MACCCARRTATPGELSAAQAVAAAHSSVHDFELRSLRGDPLPLRSFRGKALLIVNTASACGLTPQFEGLQRLHDKFSPSGFAVLGVPCDQFFRQ